MTGHLESHFFGVMEANTQKMNEMNAVKDRTSAFGVGCFHFGVRFDKPTSIDFSVYFETLRKVLNGIDAISDLELYNDNGDNRQGEEIAPTESSIIMREGEVFPHLGGFKVNFRIYIPFRIQAELIEEPEDMLTTGSEYFRVHIEYAYYGPFVVIESLNAGKESEPSQAVRIVREYLALKINSGKHFINFDFVGPSPFHANFYLVENANAVGENEMFQVQSLATRRYYHVTFRTKPVGSDPEWEERKLKLIDEISEELGLYYELIRQRTSERIMWGEIESGLEVLMAKNKPDGIKANLLSLIPFRKHKSTKQMHSRITSFRLTTISNEYLLNDGYRNVYRQGVGGQFLKQFIDKENDDLYKYPTADALDIVKFNEARTFKIAELIVIIVAAVITVLLAAILSKL